MISESQSVVSLREVLLRKALGVGMRLFGGWSKLMYRLGTLRGGLGGLDHVTLPCVDLDVAEEFYVGLLGGRVMLRLDRSALEKMGRPAAQIANSIHLSLVFADGPRIDLFQSATGQPPLLAAHPHYAFWVSPAQMLSWKKRLNDRGVPTYGPTRLGPPGQASLYFNDPSGNHLELTTIGFSGPLPVGAPDISGLSYEWRRN